MTNQKNFERGEEIPMKGGAVGYCDHCGFAIYHVQGMLYVPATGDRIHKDCWSDYAEEHMFELAEKMDEYEHCDCGASWRR